ncbi:discoidin domain-containing protein [Streptomyces sp. NBC_01471]|uniref:discoidin domain-containing protein n=1 Tax=Streptomyces sp. NBC_01471 TaxID=2903879 RepID=UPI00352FA313
MTGFRSLRRVRVLSTVVGTALALGLLSHPSLATEPTRPTRPTGTPGSSADSAWRLSTSTYRAADYQSQPYVGNGYLGQRLPATGTGYQGDLGGTGWPIYGERYAGAFVAGLYHRADNLEYIAAIPTWSTLTLGTGRASLDPGTPAAQISDYHQVVDLHRAVVTTSMTWTPSAGRATQVAFDVLSHRSREHLALVRAKITPSWSGTLDLTGLLDGAGARRTKAVSRGVDVSADTSRVTVAAQGSGTALTESATLVAGRGTRFTGRKALVPKGDAQTAGERVTVPVRAGHTYEVVKYVGVSGDADEAAATAAGAQHTGWQRLMSEHEKAWNALWLPSITTPGRTALQSTVNSSLYALYSSVRAGQAWSLGPSGLSSETYAGQVYWDADTWMYPTLLALHPELARTVVDYRYRTLDQARRNAAGNGRKGAVWPWTAGPSGLCSDVGPCKGYQDHLQNEIALAQWQYYAATGDKQWLSTRGYPVLSAVADFWADRATKGADGKYHVNGVSGADEYASGVDDHALTNGGAVVSLRHAIQAAKLLGRKAPAGWQDVADHLDLPTDADGSHPEYRGYAGQKIKQADTVLLTYPYGLVTDRAGAQADLDRYAPVTDPDGPAMTDSVHAVIAAQVGAPGCQTDTYLDRAWRPFAKAPFQQFSEARGDKAGDNAGEPAFSFLTGAGGFLQTFAYGLAGLRWDPGTLRLDPMLTPQLHLGVQLTGLAWHGRTVSVGIEPARTKISLHTGKALTVHLPDGDHRLRPGTTLTTATRQPHLDPTDDLVRCRPATADSETAGGYAEAAVDGSTATAWTATVADPALTVALRHPAEVGTAHIAFGAGRPGTVRLEGRVRGRGWTTLTTATVPKTGDLALHLRPSGQVSGVRLRLTGPTGKPTDITELEVS